MSAKEKEGGKVNEPLRAKVTEAMPLLKKRAKEKGKQQVTSTSFVHLTEADARLIKKRDRFLLGYNAQAVADGQMAIVLEASVYSNCFDRHNGLPLMKHQRQDALFNWPSIVWRRSTIF